MPHFFSAASTNYRMNFFRSTCPSPLERRRQSPNGCPPPERVRDRRGRRGVEGEECGGVSAGGMAVTPPVRRRAFRVRSPTTPPDAPERGAQAEDTRRTRTGLRALCREYPSNCCPQTDADSRLRGAGQIRICQSRVRREVARFGDNVGACPAERPAGPCRQTCPGHPQIMTKCLKLFARPPYPAEPTRRCGSEASIQDSEWDDRQRATLLRISF